MSSQYEELYGVGLLDDLHNYFPALLYDVDSFQNVQGVLRYMQEQTRNRFDLFSLGQREYRAAPAAHSAAPSPPPPPPPTTVPSVRVNVPLSDISGTAIPQNSILHASQRLAPRLANPLTSLQYVFNLPDPEEEESAAITNLLTTLLRLPLNPNARQGAGLDAFLQPVPIRPTLEQIEANTTVGNLVSDEEHACAICQDNLQPEQEGRKLNACGHWFHKHCIDTWLEGNVYCPVCRHDIREAMPTVRQQTREDLEGDLH
jgi:hypothetical protein